MLFLVPSYIASLRDDFHNFIKHAFHAMSILFVYTVIPIFHALLLIFEWLNFIAL